ncbi:MAG: SPOR domain-containing protein [Brachymonas sp.]|nr:SPOR domain-containing protein [Brachymonas sp.]
MNLHSHKQPARSAQRGIGVVGFIIGIVVGLAVALAVAVYITKVPTPFTDKGASKTAEQLAAEEARQKSWDPNAPLAGKAASGTVQPMPTTPPVVTVPGDPAGVAVAPMDGASTPADMTDVEREAELARARAEAAAKLKADMQAQEQARARARAEEAARQANASADPIGALLQARNQQPQVAAGGTLQPQTTPAASAEPFVYFVQIGAFRDPEGAESQKARASLLGMNARVNERQQAGRTVYQVRLGPYNTKAEADGARSRLEGGGMETALVRVQR